MKKYLWWLLGLFSGCFLVIVLSSPVVLFADCDEDEDARVKVVDCDKLPVDQQAACRNPKADVPVQEKVY